MSKDATDSTDLETQVDNLDGTASQLLGKRKREDNTGTCKDKGDYDDDDDDPEHSLFIPDDRSEGSGDGADSDDEPGDPEGLDSDAEEDSIPTEPYSEATEPLPDCSIYDPLVVSLTERLTAVPQAIKSIMDKFQGSSEHVNALIADANKLVVTQKVPRIRIALLGDAGSGKSSLLNSLVDIDDLAKAESGGSSCTCVPTEYSGAFKSQTKAFAASIRYYNIKKVEKLLQELLADYKLWTFQHDKDWDQDQCTRYQRAMQHALKTFRLLFCDYEEFQTDEAAQTYLRRNYECGSDGSYFDALKFFLEVCEIKLKEKITFEYGYAEFRQATTRARLRVMVDPLVGARAKFGESTLWPLVSLVVIGVRDSRLLTNITLVDLPGISDTNTFRVEMCKQYLKCCDYLWVVSQIQRVIDDCTVDNLLAAYGKRFGGKLAIVCTQTAEGVNEGLVKSLRDTNYDFGPHDHQTELLSAKKREITLLKSQIRSMRSVGNLMAFAAQDQLKLSQREHTAIDLNRFEYRVEAREADITSQLQARMQHHLPSGTTLPVFFVSNSHYSSHKGGCKTISPRLTVSMTGIPYLRAHALALPAELLMKSLGAYADHHLTAFLKAAQMWVGNGPMTVKREKELLKIVKAPQKLLEEKFATHSLNSMNTAREGPVGALDHNKVEFRRIALKKLGEKEAALHPSSILAFLRKHGNHSVKLCAKDCWNQSFAKGIRDLVKLQGEAWEQDYLDTIGVTRGWIISDLQRMHITVGEHPAASILPMQEIKELLDSQIIGIHEIFDSVISQCQKGYKNTMLDLTQDSVTNYFSRTMVPIYEICNKDHGPGVVARSISTIEDHLSEEEDKLSFTQIPGYALLALKANDNKHINVDLMGRIKLLFEETYAAFDRMVKRKFESPRERNARLALKGVLGEIVAGFDKDKKELQSIRESYAVVAE